MANLGRGYGRGYLMFTLRIFGPITITLSIFCQITFTLKCWIMLNDYVKMVNAEEYLSSVLHGKLYLNTWLGGFGEFWNFEVFRPHIDAIFTLLCLPLTIQLSLRFPDWEVLIKWSHFHARDCWLMGTTDPNLCALSWVLDPKRKNQEKIAKNLWNFPEIGKKWSKIGKVDDLDFGDMVPKLAILGEQIANTGAEFPISWTLFPTLMH